jgi:hypothetical protein
MLLFVFGFVCTTQLQQMLQQRHAARDAERAALAAEDEKRRKAALYLGELLYKSARQMCIISVSLCCIQRAASCQLGTIHKHRVALGYKVYYRDVATSGTCSYFAVTQHW